MTETLDGRSFESGKSGATSSLADGKGWLLFRVGGELFAFELAVAEEAVELPPLEPVPDASPALLGMLPLPNQLLPVYSPDRALGVARAGEAGIVLVLRAGERRIGFAVDDVEDVIMVDLARVQRPPVSDGGEKVLIGVLRHGTELVGIVDAAVLVNIYASVSSRRSA